MKEFRFNQEKDKFLKSRRGISFENIIEIIQNAGPFEAIEHPNKQKYPSQRIFLVKVKSYVYIVPFIEETDYIFLKTIYPSRKYTKKLTIKSKI